MITCPTDVVVNTDTGLCTASSVALGTPTTSDNCSISSISDDAPAVFNEGNTTVTYTVEDASGNTSSCTQLVTVEDNEDPIITCPDDVVVNTDTGLCTASGVALGVPTTSDNCSVASINDDAPVVFNEGNTTVAYTVEDASGNTSSCTQLVTVEDNEDPIITCPADVVVDTDAGLCTASGIALGTPTTSDNCSVASISDDAPAIFNEGNTTVTFTVEDASGNTSSCTQLVTVDDNEDPIITCPANVVVNTDSGLCTASGVALGTPTTSDNCSVANINDDASAIFNEGNTTVIYIVEDASGNTSSCTQLVTVEDNEDPIITCPGDVVDDTDSGLCTASGVALGTPMTSDNCSVANVSDDAPVVFNEGNTTVTYTVEDVSGNTSTCTQLVTVEDNEDPVITCPADVVVNTDSGLCTASGVTLGTPTTSDNCSIANVSDDAPTTFSLGNTTVTYTVEDASGNTSSCTQLVTVEDNEDPMITCPSDVVVSIDSGLCTARSVVLGTPTTSDNCSVANVSDDAPIVFNEGNTTVTYTVEDASGNTSSCTQLVTVEDNEDPVITCPGDVVVNTDLGLCTASGVALGTPTTSDNCSISSISDDAPAVFNEGNTTVTYTVEDASGNTSTCAQIVTVEDNEDPVITCPGDVIVDTDTGLCTASGVALGTPTTNDNCSVASINDDAPAIFNEGNTTVTYIVEDASGNTSSCTQVVTVEDGIDPVITCPTDVVVNTDTGLCTASGVALGTPTTSDNCSVASISDDAPIVFNEGNTTVTYTVEDASGNTISCTQLVTVEDNEDPVITCPADVVVDTDAGLCTASGVALGTPTTSDNCSVANVSDDAPVVFNEGNTTVTYTVEDASGNTSSCTQLVTVQDNEDPVITCPSDVVVNTDAGLCTASGVALGTPTTSDNCSVANVSDDAPAIFNEGNTTVTYTVEDASGNTSTCSQLVTVEDNEDPMITCPSDVVVNTDAGLCTASGVVLGTPTTSDNCSVPNISDDAPAIFNEGNTTITYTVEDASGNTSICSQLVTVEDNEDPVITCPADVVVNTDAGLCTASGVVLGTPTTSDNCSIASISDDAPAIFNEGNTTVTYTVEDASGNTSTCTQVVTVEDNEEPVITCPSDVVVNTDAGLCTASGVALGTPTTSDNCSVANVSDDAPAIFNEGNTTVTYTVEDASGNTSTCSQLVTVEDNEDPMITCPSDVVVNTDAGLCTASGVVLGTPTTSDNCSVPNISDDAPAIFNEGNTTITYTVEDASGNTSICSQLVTVEDNEDSVITCPADVVVNTDAGLCTASGVVLGTPTTSDNCSIASISDDAPAIFNEGNTTVTYTVEDASGNTSTCTQVVTVEDDEEPVITCPGDVVVDTDSGLCTASGVVLGVPTTSDNCSVANVRDDAPAIFSLGNTTVTYTVEDASGNTSTCTQLVTVQDNEDPVITCPADVVVGTDAGLCTVSGVAFGTPTTSDNCSVANISDDAPAIFSLGNTTVTYTVQDASGNTSSCTQLVTVEDNEDPIITCPSDVVVDTDSGLCTASGVVLGTPTTSDNCSIANISNDAPVVFNEGNTTVTYTVEDASGNTSSCTQLVTVEDNEDPIITCPSDVVVDTDTGLCTASGIALGTPTTSDNCSVASISDDAPVVFNEGSTAVTYTVEDASGNTSSCTQLVTVEDNEDPMITCPADVVVNTDSGLCTASGVTLGTPTTSDNCSATNVSDDAPVVFNEGNTTVTYTVEDASGNTFSCTQLVTVEDNEDPMITCPSDVLVNTDIGLCTASGVALGVPTTSDNCSMESLSDDIPAVFNEGSTIVTYTVEDASGNTSSCTQLVTVEDNEDPVITCPSDVVVNTDSGLCTASGVVLGTPTTSDNCSVASISDNAPAVFNEGNTTVTYIVEDASGNTSSCTQLVTVEDNEDPIITCPTDVVVNTDTGMCTASGVALGVPTTSDNCSMESLSDDIPAVFNEGSTIVTYTVEDAIQ